MKHFTRAVPVVLIFAAAMTLAASQQTSQPLSTYPANGRNSSPQQNQGADRWDATSTNTEVSLPELRYQLIAEFGPVWFCDPDLYPHADPVRERSRADEYLAAVNRSSDTFKLIMKHLGLSPTEALTSDQGLLVYREFKKLRDAIQFESMADGTEFHLAVLKNLNKMDSQKIPNGVSITGGVDMRGKIDSKSTPVVLSCPL